MVIVYKEIQRKNSKYNIEIQIVFKFIRKTKQKKASEHTPVEYKPLLLQ